MVLNKTKLTVLRGGFIIPPISKIKKKQAAKNRLLGAGWHTVSFDQRQVTRFPPIGKRILGGRYNNSI